MLKSPEAGQADAGHIRKAQPVGIITFLSVVVAERREYSESDFIRLSMLTPYALSWTRFGL